MQYRPYVIGGLLVLVSYFWHLVRRVERTMPRELIELRQSDQMNRLKIILHRRLHLIFPFF
jgi:hypothetical protein